MDWNVILTIIGSLGGFETVKWLVERRNNARILEAKADGDEFSVLKEEIQFLQEQLKQKEERFAEQTNIVRSLNSEVIKLTQEKATTELDLQRYRCVRKGCQQREPQNGY